MEPPFEINANRSLLQRVHKLVPLGGLIALAAIALAAIAVAAWDGHSGRPNRDIMLLYVGADDCAPCRSWQKGDGATFFASPDFPRIHYREVRSAHLADVLKDENWPEDLRLYRDQLKRSDGVPLWMIVSDHEILERKFGESAWRESILPRIRGLLRLPPV